jgi:hypothetical protein
MGAGLGIAYIVAHQIFRASCRQERYSQYDRHASSETLSLTHTMPHFNRPCLLDEW